MKKARLKIFPSYFLVVLVVSIAAFASLQMIGKKNFEGHYHLFVYVVNVVIIQVPLEVVTMLAQKRVFVLMGFVMLWTAWVFVNYNKYQGRFMWVLPEDFHLLNESLAIAGMVSVWKFIGLGLVETMIICAGILLQRLETKKEYQI